MDTVSETLFIDVMGNVIELHVNVNNLELRAKPLISIYYILHI